MMVREMVMVKVVVVVMVREMVMVKVVVMVMMMVRGVMVME